MNLDNIIKSEYKPLSHSVLWLNTTDNKLYHFQNNKWKPLDAQNAYKATYSSDVTNSSENKADGYGSVDVSIKKGGVYNVAPGNSQSKINELIIDLNLDNEESEVTVIIYGKDCGSDFSIYLPSNIDGILGATEEELKTKIKESYKTEINFRYNSAVVGFFEQTLASQASATDDQI